MNAISHRSLLFKACLGLIALGLVNLLFVLAGKWIKPFLPAMELTDYYVLIKVAACAMIFIFISVTGQYAQFGLKWSLKYNTLYLYWPIVVVACLILAGGSAQAPKKPTGSESVRSPQTKVSQISTLRLLSGAALLPLKTAEQ